MFTRPDSPGNVIEDEGQSPPYREAGNGENRFPIQEGRKDTPGPLRPNTPRPQPQLDCAKSACGLPVPVQGVNNKDLDAFCSCELETNDLALRLVNLSTPTLQL